MFRNSMELFKVGTNSIGKANQYWMKKAHTLRFKCVVLDHVY